MTTRDDLKSTAATALVAALVWGCGPPEIMPATPPGIQLTRVTVAEGEAAEALGEAAALGTVQQPTAAPAAGMESPPTMLNQPATKPSGLVYETLREGIGVGIKPGQSGEIHYEGKLENGKVFDSSRERNEALPFTGLGSGGLIKGMEEGIAGMKVGERRKLTIPSALAYGPQGQPPAIPPNATLIFEVDLVKIK